MHDKAAFSRGQVMPWVLGALAMIYFLFPHLLILPLKLAGVETKADPIIIPLFVPVHFLSDHLPAYETLMRKESEWTGVR